MRGAAVQECPTEQAGRYSGRLNHIPVVTVPHLASKYGGEPNFVWVALRQPPVQHVRDQLHDEEMSAVMYPDLLVGPNTASGNWAKPDQYW